jgi:hypothetical protein
MGLEPRRLVLEQYHTVGGMTVPEEITLLGFHSDLHAKDVQFLNIAVQNLYSL